MGLFFETATAAISIDAFLIAAPFVYVYMASIVLIALTLKLNFDSNVQNIEKKYETNTILSKINWWLVAGVFLVLFITFLANRATST